VILIDERGHLVSTESEEELHSFASRIGLHFDWYQSKSLHPHYDVTTKRKYQKAIDFGAQPVPTRKILKYAWRIKCP
jgi:hypothetical protein